MSVFLQVSIYTSCLVPTKSCTGSPGTGVTDDTWCVTMWALETELRFNKDS